MMNEIAKRFLMFIGALMVVTVGALVFSMSAEARDTVPEELAGLEVVVSGHEGGEAHEGSEDAEAAEAFGVTRPPCDRVSHCHHRIHCWRDGNMRYCVEYDHCHRHCLR